MTTSSWGLGQRVGFRFAVLLVMLALFPVLVDLLPKSKWFLDVWNQPWRWGIDWLSENVLGIARPPNEYNGSGDRTYDYVDTLLLMIVAVLGAVVWSIADRRRTHYPRLAALTRVMLRYVLAVTMLGYGFAKILKSQFPDLHPGRLVETVGEMSPMGLVWTFMGYSTPYTVFAGLLEAIGATLLLWRRTAIAGALLIAVVMSNVVMLNFCYDVPVKQGSMIWLMIAIAIAAPRIRPLIAAVLGRAASEAPPEARLAPRWERARRVAKVATLGLIAWQVYSEFSNKPNRNVHVHELYGAWIVDSFVVDGVDPPAMSDGERWFKLGINPRGLWIVSRAGQREGLPLVVDAAKHTITVELDDWESDRNRKKGKDGKPDKEVWRYMRPTAERLEIDGEHRGKRFHASAHLAPPTRLLTRGFRWINEEPFNR